MAVTASAVVVSCGLVGRVVRRVVAARVGGVGASCSCSSSVVASSSSSARVVPAVVVVVTGELVGSNRESSKQRHSWQPERGSIIVTLRDPGGQWQGRNVPHWLEVLVRSAVVLLLVRSAVVLLSGRVVVRAAVVVVGASCCSSSVVASSSASVVASSSASVVVVVGGRVGLDAPPVV